MPGDESLGRLRSLCTLLPEVAEIDGLGRPTFRVATRGFAVFEVIGGRPAVTVKLPRQRQAELLDRPGVSAEEETGHHGWTVLDVELAGWEQIDELVVVSYRLVAPPHVVARLDALLS
jgi:predicted DNA-binding protein (MmcQ/YjbR family)